MAWLEELQRSLGEPVIAFALENWIFLLIAGFIAVAWLFGSSSANGGFSVGVWFGGSDNDSDGDGGDGGGDGGGGGD